MKRILYTVLFLFALMQASCYTGGLASSKYTGATSESIGAVETKKTTIVVNKKSTLKVEKDEKGMIKITKEKQ